MIFVLTETNLNDADARTLYRAPQQIIRADNIDQVSAALVELDQALAAGRHCAGYFSYELGYALEPRLNGLMPLDCALPLLWFGVFEEAEQLTEQGAREFLEEQTISTHRLSAFTPGWTGAEYETRFKRVQEMISAGDIYQLNLTFPVNFSCEGSPISLYQELRMRQKVSHGALISTPEFNILSASPELFLTVRDGSVEARPMKGTAPRAPMLGEDREIINWLRHDEKSRAENLMIVDLMRNDISRISVPGSVSVSDLYTVETYPTLHQMTSGIKARLKDDLSFSEIVRSIFPSGSITGAPKIRAMELISEYEAAGRGVYTGAIGAVSPCGAMHFNVAIRTVVIMADGTGQIGIGSGLVADSEIDHEYQECLLKMRFLTERYEPFQLIETLLYERCGDLTKGGFALLDRHMDRLKASAEYFQFQFDEVEILAALDREVTSRQNALLADIALRVRLLLGRDGEISVSATAIDKPAPDKVMRFTLSSVPVNSEDVFFYHKTTRRALYDREYKRGRQELGVDEVVFFNEHGYVTEGCISNIFIEKQGRLYTPHISAGLLSGTLRAELLESGRAVEAVLRLEDLAAADAIFLGNSVRGLLKAHMED